MSSASPTADPAADPKPGPVMGVTGYDRASAGVIAVVVGLVLIVAFLFLQWLAQHEFAVRTLPPMEMIVVGGGDEDGDPDDSPLLESLAEEIPDPSLTELREDEVQMEELLETVVEISDRAANPAPQASAAEASGGRSAAPRGPAAARWGSAPATAASPRSSAGSSPSTTAAAWTNTPSSSTSSASSSAPSTRPTAR